MAIKGTIGIVTAIELITERLRRCKRDHAARRERGFCPDSPHDLATWEGAIIHYQALITELEILLQLLGPDAGPETLIFPA